MQPPQSTEPRQRSAKVILARAWHVAWPLLRLACGWTLIGLGLIGLALPIVQGLPLLVIGIALVGRRNWLIRRASVTLKLFLQRWAALPTPVIGLLGRLALRSQRRISRQIRHLHWWYAEQLRRRRAARDVAMLKVKPRRPAGDGQRSPGADSAIALNEEA